MLHKDNELLFAVGDLGHVLNVQRRAVVNKVDGITRDQFLNTPESILVEHIVASLTIYPIELHEEASEVVEQVETNIDVSQWPGRNFFRDRGPIYVPGIKIIVSIPYTGDPDLWKLRPSTCKSTFPYGNPRLPRGDGLGQIDIIIQQPADVGREKVKKLLDEQLSGIRFYVGVQKREIDEFNAALENIVRQAIRDRRERIKKNDGIVEFLGIPLKRKKEVPDILPINVRRKLVRPLPTPPKEGYKPEPGITDEDYEHILSVIRHEGRTFEATPITYAVHDEEELRDIFLAHLNGHYQGGATAETFRRSGKTDIRIEDNSRAAFVAECKVWKGAKELKEAVDQLLRYLTWRDCKAATVVFNKHIAKFTELINKVPEMMKSHSHMQREIGKQHDGEWRYVFKSQEDDLRHIIVHVFLFNLYSKQK